MVAARENIEIKSLSTNIVTAHFYDSG